MKLTAPVAIADRPVEEAGLTAWANDEVVPLMRQVRQALNSQLRERPTPVDSAGAGAYVRLWTSDTLPTDACWAVVAEVVGVSTSGAFQAARYTLEETFISNAGAVSSVAATTVASHETAAAINARFGVDAGDRVVYLESRDDAVSPMRWVALVRMLEITP